MKNFRIAIIFLILLCFNFFLEADARKKHKKNHKKSLKLHKSHKNHKYRTHDDEADTPGADIAFLNSLRVKKDADLHKPSNNLKMVKGVIKVFLSKLGVTEEDQSKALRTTIKNINHIMMKLRSLVKGTSDISIVKNLGELFSKDFTTWSKYTNDKIKISNAVKEIKQYIHASKVIKKDEKTGNQAKNRHRHRRVRRHRRH